MNLAFGNLPLYFEPNRGQSAEEVQFRSRGDGYTLFLTGKELVLSLVKPSEIEIHRAAYSALKSPPRAASVVRMRLLDANPSPKAAGQEIMPGKSNYFVGDDPGRWRTDVPHFARVAYRSVYPGIDLFYYGNQRRLELDDHGNLLLKVFN